MNSIPYLLMLIIILLSVINIHLGNISDSIQVIEQHISEIPLKSPEKLSKPFSFNQGTDTLM